MKHHYIPASYLKRWTGADKQLCQYSRPHFHVVPKRIAPAGTGYVEDLYALHGQDDDKIRHLVERKFFQQVDQAGSDAISLMLDPLGGHMPDLLRYGWCVFLMSLLLRAPAKVNSFNQHSAEVYPEEAVDLPFGLSRFGADLFMRSVISKRVVEFIYRMDWSVHALEPHHHSLITCDSPLMMTNLLAEQAHIYLPLGPRHFFIATTKRETRDLVDTTMRQRGGIAEANGIIVEEAFRYVYGVDNKHLRFIENRMAPKDRPFLSKVPIKRPEYPTYTRPRAKRNPLAGRKVRMNRRHDREHHARRTK